VKIAQVPEESARVGRKTAQVAPKSAPVEKRPAQVISKSVLVNGKTAQALYPATITIKVEVMNILAMINPAYFNSFCL